MCGICGVIRLDGSPGPAVDPAVLDAMTDVMVHRGPDDRGTHVADGVAFGARRLSIIDVEGGHQPFANESGDVWAMQNGELYNHVELHAALARDGHVLHTRCDTEILPHLYERDGTAFARALNGDFAIAIWDARRRRGVIARDRAGVKPLYYAQRGDRLVFASELKSLLASGLVEPEVDPETVEVFLDLGYVPFPRTLLRGVRKLGPGEVLVAEDGTVRTAEYWSHPRHAPRARSGADRRGVAEVGAELVDRLDRSVRRRLMSDVPLGAMLSGGLDSSLLVALMARHGAAPVKTFAIGFAEAGADNELGAARRVAQHFGTEHHELELSFRDVPDLETLVWQLDEPVAELSTLGFLLLSALARQSVTVALSGQGADELFGGYRKHRAAALAEHWQRLPAAVRAAGRPVAGRAPARVRRAARTLAAADPVQRHLAMSGQLDPAARAALLRGTLAQDRGGATARAIAPHAQGLADDPLAASLYLDARLALVDVMLHYFDRASMAHSLEIRVPYLDHEVVEFGAAIPSSLKVRGLTTKHVLKEAARPLLPADVIDRRKVGFFRQSATGWLQAQAGAAIGEHLLTGTPRYAEFLDRTAVERLVRRFAAGEEAGRTQLLLAILMLELWLSAFLPRAMRAVPAGAGHGTRPGTATPATA